jgi:hypothetical protein
MQRSRSDSHINSPGEVHGIAHGTEEMLCVV